jgi:preprotein translocase subunit SecG
MTAKPRNGSGGEPIEGVAVATTENKPWWSPIIITAFGLVIIMTNVRTWLPPWLLNLAVLLVGLFLILLILIQRGKGGGLSGAFGGVGGSSPFGSRAGDIFTRYTITVATLWIWLVLIEVKVIQDRKAPRRGAEVAVVEQ